MVAQAGLAAQAHLQLQRPKQPKAHLQLQRPKQPKANSQKNQSKVEVATKIPSLGNQLE
jgi:hypothetical protein